MRGAVVLLGLCLLSLPALAQQGQCYKTECPAGTPKAGHLVDCTNSHTVLMQECGVRVQSHPLYRPPYHPPPLPRPEARPRPPAKQPDPEELRREREAAARAAQDERIHQQAGQAFDEMRGVGGSGDLSFKMDHGNSAMLGMKGISAADAAAKIDTSAPQPPHDIATAWQRLHCAATILNRAASIPVGLDDIGKNVDTIRALAEDGIQALRGKAAEPDCGGGPMPAIVHDPSRQFSQLSTQLTRLDRDSTALQVAERRLAQLKGQPKSSPSSTPPPPPPDKTGSPRSTAVAPPHAEPPQQPPDPETLRIQQAWQESQQNAQKKDADLALVRAMQQQLDAINSTKIATEQDLMAVQATTKDLLASTGASQ